MKKSFVIYKVTHCYQGYGLCSLANSTNNEGNKIKESDIGYSELDKEKCFHNFHQEVKGR
jgi:hypothetical protein